tara:strand:+ start:4772 stop:5593 length:822 start_codon:yes stop_codon:yes gene_type:complete
MQTVCCIGDSLTQGNYSYDWVSSLSKKIPFIEFINMGKNGETAKVLRMRLQKDVIDLNPDYVIVLIGGNDLIGATHPTAGKMYVDMFPDILNRPPCLEDYKDEMIKIVHELDSKLPKDTKVLILSPPPIGEGGHKSDEWKLGLEFSYLCRNSVREVSPRIEFMDLYNEVQLDMISHINGKYTPLTLSLNKMMFSYMLSYVLDWKRISWINNYKYTTDGIHFSKHFGNVIEGMIRHWFETYLESEEVITIENLSNKPCDLKNTVLNLLPSVLKR